MAGDVALPRTSAIASDPPSDPDGDELQPDPSVSRLNFDYILSASEVPTGSHNHPREPLCTSTHYHSLSSPARPDRCTLPKCLFAHQKPLAMKSESSASAAASPEVPSEKQAVQVAAEDGQRKRRKIGHGDIWETESSSENAESKPAPKISTSTSSEKRPISPPPPRRTSSLAPAKKPEGTSKTEPKAAATAKPAPKAAAVASKPAKAETLNPRLLKHSPATHDLRTKLVKLLHDQLVRLNTALAKESPSEKSLILTTQQLITMALDIEEQAAKDKPAIHSSVVKNTIVRYKKMSVNDWKSARQTEIDAIAAKSNPKSST
ncbi:hypothetical protein V490_06490, partial [Pseudogymnoascus sp. VKM F-3557]